MSSIKISVEYLREPNRASECFEVTRVPCVGEWITDANLEMSYEVKSVIHVARKSPVPHSYMQLVEAIIRVI